MPCYDSIGNFFPKYHFLTSVWPRDHNKSCVRVRLVGYNLLRAFTLLNLLLADLHGGGLGKATTEDVTDEKSAASAKSDGMVVTVSFTTPMVDCVHGGNFCWWFWRCMLCALVCLTWLLKIFYVSDLRHLVNLRRHFTYKWREMVHLLSMDTMRASSTISCPKNSSKCYIPARWFSLPSFYVEYIFENILVINISTVSPPFGTLTSGTFLRPVLMVTE